MDAATLYFLFLVKYVGTFTVTSCNIIFFRVGPGIDTEPYFHSTYIYKMAQYSLSDSHDISEGIEDDYSDKDGEDYSLEDNEISKFFSPTFVFYR